MQRLISILISLLIAFNSSAQFKDFHILGGELSNSAATSVDDIEEVLPRMKAGEASEYFIFVEAYIHLGRWDEAMALFPRIHQEAKSLDAVFCSHLRGWIEENKPEDQSVIFPLINAMNSVGCSISEN